MATERVLATATLLASLPHLALARIVEALRLPGPLADLRKCISVVDCAIRPESTTLTRALILAEDHRSSLHPGIDPIGIARAALAWVFSRQVQGASTIEQQFVRTVTGRYQRSMGRKLREQIVAVLLCRHRSKEAVCSAYLSVAFFGHQCVGVSSALGLIGVDERAVDEVTALELMAWLKYPRPKNPSIAWKTKIDRRTAYLESRNHWTANKAIQRTAQTVTQTASAIWPPVRSAADRRR